MWVRVWVVGRKKAYSAIGKDMEAELVASNGRQACQSTLARPRQCTRRRSWFTETGGTPTRLFEFQFVLNAHAEAASHESSPYDDRDFGSSISLFRLAPRHSH